MIPAELHSSVEGVYPRSWVEYIPEGGEVYFQPSLRFVASSQISSRL